MLRFALRNSMRSFALPWQPIFYFSNLRNYYDILGVKKDSSQDEIKKRFHTLAKMYHPDTQGSTPQDQEKFKDIVQAYNVLSNEQERKKFDDLFFSNAYKQQSNMNSNYSSTQGQSQNQKTNKASETKRSYQKWSSQYEQQQKYREQNEELYEEGFFKNMKKAPELYFVSFLMVAILVRWYFALIDAKASNLRRTFPEDPDFIREKEEINRRYNPNKKRVLITDNDCRHLPIQIIDEMESSGDYELSPICRARVEDYRNSVGQRIEIDIPIPRELKKPKRKSSRVEIPTEQISEDSIQSAMIFKDPPTRKADYISKENLQEILNDKKPEQ